MTMINDAGLTLAVMAVAFAATMVGRFVARRFSPRHRPIPAYVVLPELAADAVESNFLLHFSMGSSALGETSTISALVSAEVIYRLAERLAVSYQTPLITTGSTITLPLAQDTLRRAFEHRQNMASYHTSAAAWYPQGPRSLAFAAGVASLSADKDAASNILLGRFGYEAAWIGESALRYDQGLIMHSDLVEGQALAYAQADHMLLGEELYVGPAYLNGSALEHGGVFALDVLRWLVILGILAAALQSAL
jgi:hypothetical protein